MTEGGRSLELKDGGTVAIIGGGPAGAFSAIHLLRRAGRGRRVHPVIFERNCEPGAGSPDLKRGPYSGCPKCAGGLSPPLCDALKELHVSLPDDVVQANIDSVTVQGSWKSIVLPVPRERRIVSVYRGTLPFAQHHQACFDAMMLEVATRCGAEVIGGRVSRVDYVDGGLDLAYCVRGVEHHLAADMVIFAGGVNEKPEEAGGFPHPVELLRRLQPAYVPPRTRKALIFELAAPPRAGVSAAGELHYIECSSGGLQLDMCSVLSKRGYITITLIGRSVDRARDHRENFQVIRDFLAVPQIQRTLPSHAEPDIHCICNPSLVIGTATNPLADRVAAVGDMAACRQYKDGIWSAYRTAESLAATILDEGIDQRSLRRGYNPTLAGFRRDNRYATLIFFLWRRFFTSPTLSRFFYQAYASEKKYRPERERSVKWIFWAIASGDGAYRDIAWSMLRPRTLWMVFWGGVLVTLRNRAAELFFGLDWHGISRVPTAVSMREMAVNRARLLPRTTEHPPEFECMYTVRVRASAEKILALLARFGEPDRPYLNPRWVRVRRASGEPLEPGCVIDYSVFGGLFAFSIEQLPHAEYGVVAYRVRDGFANDGDFIFEVLPRAGNSCDLTVYLAFDYPRGQSLPDRLYWWLFKTLFPDFIHDVLWNQALCELKDLAEESVVMDPEVLARSSAGQVP